MTSTRFLRGTSVCLVLVLSTLTQANWTESCDGAFDVSTWLFRAYPEGTGTFSATIAEGPEGNGYLTLAETNSRNVGGSVLGLGLVTSEEFADVRVGALVNLTGDARSYHGLGARTTYFLDDSSISGAAGVIASSYIMLIHWQDGPANLRIEVFKTVNGEESVMKTYHEITASGLDHARSRYAELDVVGSGPVYITGCLYESKGGGIAGQDAHVGRYPWGGFLGERGLSRRCLSPGFQRHLQYEPVRYAGRLPGHVRRGLLRFGRPRGGQSQSC
ncbi:MAG: hypothetical protein JSW27_01620 [Phycisphaerales bacterium]|nr:MAG: hypothetical protein JSW27_01620 [Phycisphaerales bacterium]